MKNRDVLPQYHWENDHPAIIKREQWDKVQVLLATKQGRGHRQIGEIKKKFTVARVKTGVLRGYFLLDANWTKDEREQFIKIIESVNDLENE